jgi:ABC-type sugar transport system ATPase subunit
VAVKLEIQNLTKVFNKQEILHGLNFTVNDGEFLSILGPSGCGKTPSCEY